MGVEFLCEQQHIQDPSPCFYEPIQDKTAIYRDEAKPNLPEINSA